MSNTFFELFRCHRFQSRKMLIQIIKIIRRIKDSNFKLHCFSELTRFYEDREGKDPTIMREMEKFPDSIPDLRDQGYAGLQVASIYIKAKKYRRAWKLLKPDVFYIRNLKSRQVWICDLYARMGKFAQALEYATTNDRALSGIAFQYAEAREFKKAIVLSRKIKDKEEKGLVLRSVAAGYAEVRKFKKAIALAQSLHSEHQSVAFSEIACHYALAGKFESALRMVSRAKPSLDKTWALQEIAVQYAKRNQFDKALEIVKKIGSNYSPSLPPIIDVADTFIKSRSQDQALFQKILELARQTISDKYDKEEMPWKFRRLLLPAKNGRRIIAK